MSRPYSTTPHQNPQSRLALGFGTGKAPEPNPKSPPPALHHATAPSGASVAVSPRSASRHPHQGPKSGETAAFPHTLHVPLVPRPSDVLARQSRRAAARRLVATALATAVSRFGGHAEELPHTLAGAGLWYLWGRGPRRVDSWSPLLLIFALFHRRVSSSLIFSFGSRYPREIPTPWRLSALDRSSSTSTPARGSMKCKPQSPPWPLALALPVRLPGQATDNEQARQEPRRHRHHPRRPHPAVQGPQGRLQGHLARVHGLRPAQGGARAVRRRPQAGRGHCAWQRTFLPFPRSPLPPSPLPPLPPLPPALPPPHEQDD